MKKLNDKAFRIWLFTVILIGILFVFPAGKIVELTSTWIELTITGVRIATVAGGIVLAMLAYSRYSRFAMSSANHAANYDEREEAEEDINNDVFTYTVLLGISVAFVCIPAGMFAFAIFMGMWNIVFAAIQVDWIIGYAVIAVFNFMMAFLREYERKLTTRNALERMKEQNPMRVAGGS